MSGVARQSAGPPSCTAVRSLAALQGRIEHTLHLMLNAGVVAILRSKNADAGMGNSVGLEFTVTMKNCLVQMPTAHVRDFTMYYYC